MQPGAAISGYTTGPFVVHSICLALTQLDLYKHEPGATPLRYFFFCSRRIVKSFLNVFPKHFGRAREKVSHVTVSEIYFWTFGLFDFLLFRSLFFLTLGFLDVWTLGRWDFGTFGFVDFWTFGLFDLLTFGLLYFSTFKLLDLACFAGLLDFWTF